MTILIIIITVIISLICFRSERLLSALAMSPYEVRRGQWYRVITHMFVHGSMIHLAVNMLVLYSFGSHVESLFARMQSSAELANADLTFLLLYFLGGVVATLPDLFTKNKDTKFLSIGASGAVSAVVFTSIFFSPWSMLYLFGVVPIPGIVFGLAYLGYSYYMGRKGGTGINHNAHLWGALFGFIFPLFIDINFINHFLGALFKGF